MYWDIYSTYVEDDMSEDLSNWVGLSVKNTAIFGPLTLNSDGDAEDVFLSSIEDEMDRCLMLTSSEGGGALHVHTMSPCFAPQNDEDSSLGSTTEKPGVCDSDFDCASEANWVLNWDSTASDYGGIFGIARDGHVIYGPYNGDGEVWACEDLDVCNGFFVDSSTGEYAYATTTFFPYVVGCWGPVYPST